MGLHVFLYKEHIYKGFEAENGPKNKKFELLRLRLRKKSQGTVRNLRDLNLHAFTKNKAKRR